MTRCRNLAAETCMARNGSENMTSMLILCFFKSVVDSNLVES